MSWIDMNIKDHVIRKDFSLAFAFTSIFLPQDQNRIGELESSRGSKEDRYAFTHYISHNSDQNLKSRT